MDRINKFCQGYTPVSDYFIDHLMAKAPGEFVKVYLCLLRAYDGGSISASDIADRLENSEKDVGRAFAYWERAGVLRVSRKDGGLYVTGFNDGQSAEGLKGASRQDGTAAKGMRPESPEHGPGGDQPRSITENGSRPEAADVMPHEDPAETAGYSQAMELKEGGSPAADDPFYWDKGRRGVVVVHTPVIDAASDEDRADAQGYDDGEAALSAYLDYSGGTGYAEIPDDDEYRMMLFAAEKYLGRPLSPRDTQLFRSLRDSYGFSCDMIEYLVEYCVERGIRTTRYMEAVAMEWHKDGLTSVSKIKEERRAYSRETKAILKAFGITGRTLADVEREFVDKWIKKDHFSLELVLEACGQTMSAIGKPNFRYADMKLESWKEAGVTTVEDAVRFNEERRRAAAAAHSGAGKGGSGQAGNAAGANRGQPPNRFHNFEQRQIDYDSLLTGEVGIRRKRAQKPDGGAAGG